MRFNSSILLLLGLSVVALDHRCAADPGVALPTNIEAELVRMADPKVIFINALFTPMLKGLPEEQKHAVVARAKGMLGSEHLEVRRRAALLLGELGDKSGVRVMIKDMAVKDANERGNVSVALRLLKDERAIPVLTEATDDPSPYVRSIALCALGELKAKDTFDKIAARLTDKEKESNSCIPLYPATSACYALGLLGDRKAVPVLVKVLDDPDVASFAAKALSEITKTGEKWDAAQWKTWWSMQHR